MPRNKMGKVARKGKFLSVDPCKVMKFDSESSVSRGD
jgi:hypothetical protein